MLRPVFSPAVTAWRSTDEGLLLFTQDEAFLLSGRVFRALGELIDGRRSADEIVSEANRSISLPEAYYGLALLERRGLLVEAGSYRDPPGKLEEFALLHGLRPDSLRDKLTATPVALEEVGGAGADAVLPHLNECGLRVTGVGEAGVTLLLVESYLDAEIARVEARCRRLGHALVLAQLHGRIALFGPELRPGRACWACMSVRMRRHRPVHEHAKARLGVAGLDRAYRGRPTEASALAGGWVAERLLVWVAQRRPDDRDREVVHSLDKKTLKVDEHALIPLPHCPACRPVTDTQKVAPPAPFQIEETRKLFFQYGGHRTEDPDVTYARYKHLVSPLLGVVGSVAASTIWGDRDPPVYLSDHNLSRSASSLDILRKGLRHKSGGKGATHAQAKASALCEALERHSGIYQGDEYRIAASYRQLGDTAIYPNRCMLYSRRQYEKALSGFRPQSFTEVIPLPFDESKQIEWTPVWSLTKEGWRHLPTEYCYYNYRPESVEFCHACSNGAAGGNTRIEAAVQGLLELIERDAVAIWWYNRLVRPEVDLASAADPYVRTVSAMLDEKGRDLWVLDVTCDTEVPVYVAVSCRRERERRDRIVFGFGAHLEPAVALRRAVSELVQMLPYVVNSFDHDAAAESPGDPQAVRWLKTATVEGHAYLSPCSGGRKTLVPPVPTLAGDRIDQDLGRCVALLAGLGIEVLALDQTRSDVGLPVVKMFAPGLRHFWPRFAPGRLYDVPVKMGWLPAALAEGDLNPTHLFM